MDPARGTSAYEAFCDELRILLTTQPPEFIYIQDTESPRTTAGVVDALLRDISKDSNTRIRSATVDGVSCFTSRLFYEGVINSLAGWTPTWEDGCGNWNADSDVRWNENIDTFIHGLRSLHDHLVKELGDKGQGATEENYVRLVIVVQRADRLKDSLPDLIVPLTRLAELTRLDLSVIFISQVRWEDVRPPLGASPDPYYMDVNSLSKEDIVNLLIARFPKIYDSLPSTDILKNPYHIALKPLYESFAQVVCDVCYMYTHNPEDIQYIAAARWPGYSKPLLDEYRKSLLAEDDPIRDFDEDEDDPPVRFEPPSMTVRMRLSKVFNPSLANAMETLIPRLTNAADWAAVNVPREDILLLDVRDTAHVHTPPNRDNAIMLALPRISQFILVASFIASTNPPKSDFRLFHRGTDGSKRKRVTKAGGRPRKGGGPSKVAQRLLGPQPFALDRMLAILGALVENNDPPEPELQDAIQFAKYHFSGEATDMEITRVGVYSSVVELASKRLLHRTSPADRLDGPPMYKVAISNDTALMLAKHLGVTLHDLIWDPN